MPRATLHCGGRSPVDGAWDAEKIDNLSETLDPFEKTGCQDVRRGVIYPGKLVCLVFRSNPSLFCGCYPIIG